MEFTFRKTLRVGLLLGVMGGAHIAQAVFEPIRCPECFGNADTVIYARIESLVIGVINSESFDVLLNTSDTESGGTAVAFEAVLRLSKDGKQYARALKVIGAAPSDKLPAAGTEGLMLLRTAESTGPTGRLEPACAFPDGFFPLDKKSDRVMLNNQIKLTLSREDAFALLRNFLTLRRGADASWRAMTLSAQPEERTARLWLSGILPASESATLAGDVLFYALGEDRKVWTEEESHTPRTRFQSLLEVAWPLLSADIKAEVTRLLISDLDRYPCLLKPEEMKFLLRDGIGCISDPEEREKWYRLLFKAHDVSDQTNDVAEQRVFCRFSDLWPWAAGVEDEAFYRVVMEIARGRDFSDFLRDGTDLKELMRCLARSRKPEALEIIRNIAESGTLPANMVISDTQVLAEIVSEARKLVAGF
ncbi:MAG TPA: hypothetical protein PLO53_09055 [Candidatus Hydrogenedentes bacterium]|nr:hypothetical protein [Candidatus Hydrogenedentota bacterium]